MSVSWTDALVSDALDGAAIRLERLREEYGRGQGLLQYARALDARAALRARSAGIAQMIERAALRDDVASLAQAQVQIAEQRREIARLEALIAALQTERNIDALTGCLDRGGFDEILGREWSRAMRGRTSLGLVFADVNGFKHVNDTLGHAAGDEALRAIAHALQGEARRSGEVVARYGGDEFVIVVPQAELAAVLALGERARSAVSALRLSHANTVVPLSVSVGVAATVPSLAANKEELLRRADGAMYRAKQTAQPQAIALEVEQGVDVFYAPKAQPAGMAAPARTSARTR